MVGTDLTLMKVITMAYEIVTENISLYFLGWCIFALPGCHLADLFREMSIVREKDIISEDKYIFSGVTKGDLAFTVCFAVGVKIVGFFMVVEQGVMIMLAQSAGEKYVLSEEYNPTLLTIILFLAVLFGSMYLGDKINHRDKW